MKKEIKKLAGLDDQVYSIIGKFAMNKDVIEKLDNPITTSFKHSWYLLYIDGQLDGFCSIKMQNYSVRISNIVSIKRSVTDFMKDVLTEIESDLRSSNFKTVSVYCLVKDISLFKIVGFSETARRVKWATVEKQIR